MEQPEVKEQVATVSASGNDAPAPVHLCRETGGKLARSPGVPYLRNGARHQRRSCRCSQLRLRHRQD